MRKKLEIYQKQAAKDCRPKLYDQLRTKTTKSIDKQATKVNKETIRRTDINGYCHLPQILSLLIESRQPRVQVVKRTNDFKKELGHCGNHCIYCIYNQIQDINQVTVDVFRVWTISRVIGPFTNSTSWLTKTTKSIDKQATTGHAICEWTDPSWYGSHSREHL